MSTSIPNLWPSQFNVDVLSPYAILQVQAGLLGKLTRGTLEGEVETVAEKDSVLHRLVVVAPAVNGYRRTLLGLRHDANLPYPVEVMAKSLARPGSPSPYPSASDEETLQELLQRALAAEDTTAVILSLLARSNEARGVKAASDELPASNP